LLSGADFLLSAFLHEPAADADFGAGDVFQQRSLLVRVRPDLPPDHHAIVREEFKLGTIEPLMTARCATGRSCSRNSSAHSSFYFVLWDPNDRLFLGLSSRHSSNPPPHSTGRLSRLLPHALLLGMFYVSIGCFASVVTKKPDRRRGHFLLRDHASFFLRAHLVHRSDVSSTTRQLLGYFSALEQMARSRAARSIRADGSLVSMTIVMLSLTYQAFQSRKWEIVKMASDEQLRPSRERSTAFGSALNVLVQWPSCS